MFLRRSRGQLKVSIDDDLADVEGAAPRLEIPDSYPDPEVRYLQREKARILAAAIQELRPRLREAIELRELAQLSTEETARRMGLSVGAVKARIFHGRRKLRKALRRYMRPRRMRTSDNFAIAGSAKAAFVGAICSRTTSANSRIRGVQCSAYGRGHQIQVL